MATLQDDIEAINTRFYALWPSATLVIADNDRNTDTPEDAVWCRFSIVPGAERRVTIGSKTWEQLGRVYLQIFVPDERGTSEAYALANTFTTIFREWASPDYRIRFSTPEFRPSNEDGEPFTLVVSIPFTAKH
jgi:hypothetical protein